jgi:hypothetical protein
MVSDVLILKDGRVLNNRTKVKIGSVEVISTDSKHQLLCKISSSNPKEIIVDDMMQAYVWFQYYKYDNTKHHEVEQRTIYKQSTCQRWAVN